MLVRGIKTTRYAFTVGRCGEKREQTLYTVSSSMLLPLSQSHDTSDIAYHDLAPSAFRKLTTLDSSVISRLLLHFQNPVLLVLFFK